MKGFQPSRTAEYMAFFRALESARPAPRRLFNDPFAPHFLSRFLRSAAALARVPVFAPVVNAYTDFRLPGARTSAIARTKLIDDLLIDALQQEISQVVILGSGFDCRAYRLPQLDGATVFEVDHPATLAIKLARLHQLVSRIPEQVHHVQIDFMRQPLPDVLAQAGFQTSRAAVFLWEGVTQYLTHEAIDSVLHFVAGCGRGTRIIFTYVHSGMLDGSVSFNAAKSLLDSFAKLGEPWVFGLRPEQISEFVRARGLHLDRDLAACEYRELYFGNAAKRMKGYEFYHAAMAHVGRASNH